MSFDAVAVATTTLCNSGSNIDSFCAAGMVTESSYISGCLAGCAQVKPLNAFQHLPLQPQGCLKTTLRHMKVHIFLLVLRLLSTTDNVLNWLSVTVL